MKAQSVVLGMILLSLPGLTAAGQFAPGDAIVAVAAMGGSGKPLLGVTPQGVVYTVTSLLPRLPTMVIPAPDNRGVLLSAPTQNITVGMIFRVAPDGSITSIHQGLHYYSMHVDGHGNIVGITCSNGGQWHVVRLGNSGATTLYAGNHWVATVGGIDLPTGDFVFTDPQYLYRISLHGPNQVTTLLKQAPIRVNALGSVHADPDTGDLIGFWNVNQSPQLPYYPVIHRLRVGSPSRLTTIASGWFSGSVGASDRDPATGQFVLPGHESSGRHAIFRYDLRTNAVSTLASLPTNVSPLAVAVAGSRHLAGLDEAKPGQVYRLLVSSPTEIGADYAIGLSLGIHPGIPVAGGRRLPLNPDPLFFWSIQNTGVFSGFRGRLNLRGEALGKIAFPALPALSGIRFFACAITIANSRISVISEPLGVTID